MFNVFARKKDYKEFSFRNFKAVFLSFFHKNFTIALQLFFHRKKTIKSHIKLPKINVNMTYHKFKTCIPAKKEINNINIFSIRKKYLFRKLKQKEKKKVKV